MNYSVNEEVVYFRTGRGSTMNYRKLPGKIIELQKNIRPSMMTRVRIEYSHEGVTKKLWVNLEQIEKKKL